MFGRTGTGYSPPEQKTIVSVRFLTHNGIHPIRPARIDKTSFPVEITDNCLSASAFARNIPVRPAERAAFVFIFWTKRYRKGHVTATEILSR